MFFDLSPNIILSKNSQKNYLLWRTVLYLTAFFLASYLVFAILFPSALFSFSFLNPNSNKNSPLNPRDKSGTLPEEGKISSQTGLIFDAPLAGNYSKIKLTLEAGNKIIDLSGQEISLKKSYQSFFYPEESSLGFKDGSLIRSGDNFYLIGNQKAHRFLNKTILTNLGYFAEDFTEVSPEELNLTPEDQIIENDKSYPEYSLFKINGTYYQLREGQLQKFISPQAFLSQYDDRQAISKEKEFLDQISVSKNQIGFSDGLLISYGEAVYIVSENEVLPIDNPITFEKSGYLWEDIIPVNGDELYFYQKGKLFNIGKAHPSGTVFRVTESDKYYLIKGKAKFLLPSEKIARSWFKKTPVMVSQESLSQEETCLLEKTNDKEYDCELSLEKFKNIPGKDYEFELKNNEDTEIDSLGIIFKKAINKENFRSAISDIINKIIINYAGKK